MGDIGKGGADGEATCRCGHMRNDHTDDRPLQIKSAGCFWCACSTFVRLTPGPPPGRHRSSADG